MPKFNDLTGQRFARLVAVEPVGKDKHGRIMWKCVCDCGKEHVVSSNVLLMGRAKSCGCLNEEQRHKRGFEANRTKHDLCGTRIYRIWQRMKARCYNPNTDDYKLYGERGIRVCDEWLHNPKAFADWSFANGYSDELSIDRIDVNGDYSPDNCRWASNSEQANNKRTNRLITIDGETKTLAQWSKVSGLDHVSILQRLNNGKTGKELIAPPTRKGRD